MSLKSILLQSNPAVWFQRFQYYLAWNKWTKMPSKHGFSIVVTTHNRSAFLEQAIKVVLKNTSPDIPFELIIMDNHSNDATEALVRAYVEQYPQIVKYHKLKQNFGTNAYALGFLHAQYDYLVDMDDDVLALSQDWNIKVRRVFEHEACVGFLCLNVIQDKFTGGAKPDIAHYRIHQTEVATLEIGPTGGWFAITPRQLYKDLGGFIFNPYKLFQSEDGTYYHKVLARKLLSGILQDTFVYHASGAYWNKAFGYHKVYKGKYHFEHKKLEALIDTITLTDLPTFTYAEEALLSKERELQA